MAGVKGRSGRKSTSKEQKRLAVLDQAWEIIANQFNDPNVPMILKLEIAVKLAVKTIPQQVDGIDMRQVVIMGEIKRGGEPLRYNIGSPDAISE
jgi:hypothetical protein